MRAHVVCESILAAAARLAAEPADVAEGYLVLTHPNALVVSFLRIKLMRPTSNALVAQPIPYTREDLRHDVTAALMHVLHWRRYCVEFMTFLRSYYSVLLA